MTNREKKKEVKNQLIYQLIAAACYVCVGAVMVVIQIANRRFSLDITWIIGLTMLVVGLLGVGGFIITFNNPEEIRKIMIKKYDPSSWDIRQKCIKGSYYGVYFFGIGLFALFVQIQVEMAIGILLLLVLTLLIHVSQWIYYKVSYNIKKSKKTEEGEDEK